MIALAGLAMLTGSRRSSSTCSPSWPRCRGTVFSPAEAALLPALARTPEELTAANVSSSTLESLGSFVGPALGGLLLAASSTSVFFVVTRGSCLWSAFIVSGVPEPPREPRATSEPRRSSTRRLAGFRASERPDGCA